MIHNLEWQERFIKSYLNEVDFVKVQFETCCYKWYD